MAPDTIYMKTIIIGMGNTILCDDGVGIRVARLLKDRLAGNESVEVCETHLAGMNIVPTIEGYGRAVIIDAIETEKPVPGALHRLRLEDLAATLHITSPHGTNLYTSIELAKRCGLSMPETITIFAIEIEDASTFSATCTPAVESRITEITEDIFSFIENIS